MELRLSGKSFLMRILFIGLLTLSFLVLFAAEAVHATPPVGPGTAYPTDAGPHAMATGDFNGDGYPDIVTANRDSTTVTVLMNNGNGTFAAGVNYQAGPLPGSVVVGDFNGDGRPDIAVTNGCADRTVSILLNKGDGTFSPRQTYQVGYTPSALAVGDFNGDGHLDLVVLNGWNHATILFGKGDGTFTVGPTYTVGKGPTRVAVSDLNHDGHPDIVALNTLDSTITVLFNRGDGTFAPGVTYAVNAHPTALAVGDFTANGYPDIAVTSAGATAQSNGTVEILLNKGDGTFNPGVSYMVGKAPAAIGIGDFNTDGFADLAVTNVGDNTVELLLNSGSGTFAPGPLYPVGPELYALAVGDFNADGQPDLAVASTYSHSVTVLLTQSLPPSLSISDTAQGGSNFKVGDTISYVLTVTNQSSVGTVTQRGSVNVTAIIPVSLGQLVIGGPGGWQYKLTGSSAGPLIIKAVYCGQYPILPHAVLPPLTITGVLPAQAAPMLTTIAVVSAPTNSNAANDVVVNTITVSAV